MDKVKKLYEQAKFPINAVMATDNQQKHWQVLADRDGIGLGFPFVFLCSEGQTLVLLSR